MSTEGKTCCGCELFLPLANYPADRRHRDGVASRCYRCEALRARDYYRRHPKPRATAVRPTSPTPTKDPR